MALLVFLSWAFGCFLFAVALLVAATIMPKAPEPPGKCDDSCFEPHSSRQDIAAILENGKGWAAQPEREVTPTPSPTGVGMPHNLAGGGLKANALGSPHQNPDSRETPCALGESAQSRISARPACP